VNLKRVQRIYDRLPICLQNVAVSAYGYHLQRQRYGGESRRYTEELLRHEALPADEIRALQIDLLRGRALLALEKVPAYRTLQDRIGEVKRAKSPDEILALLPILTKEEVRRAPESFIPEGVTGPLLRATTGGTTGKPLLLYRTLSGTRRNFAFFARTRAWRKLTEKDRTATLMGRLTVPEGQAQPPYWRHSRLTDNLLFSSYHMSPKALPEYARALVDFAPKQVVCYPSSGAPVASAILRAGLAPKGMHAVFTTAETLSPRQREVMELAFGCPVADQYGSGEWTVVISQCEHGTYHLHPDYGYLEVLDRQGEPCVKGTGRVVASGFINDAMVLLRYDTGDLVNLDGRPCSCGRAFPTIQSIEGRAEDSIRTSDGREIGRLYNFVFAETSGIAEGQLVQRALDDILVRVVPGRDWQPQGEESIRHSLKSRLGPEVGVQIEYVDSIPRTVSGKFLGVISLDRYHRNLRGGI